MGDPGAAFRFPLEEQMRREKQTAAVEEPEPIIEFAGDLPAREIEIIKPFTVQGDNGELLEWGKRYRVGHELAADLVRSGRAFDIATGERYDTRPGGVNEPKVRPVQQRTGSPYTGKPVRIRVRPGFSIQLEDDRVLVPGEECFVGSHMLAILGTRVELLDVKQFPEHRIRVDGEPHPVRINAGGHGLGIWSVALDRHVEHGEEVVLPDSEASILIAMGRAVSLRPHVPSPAAIELGELIAGDDQEKAAKVATLATRILRAGLRN